MNELEMNQQLAIVDKDDQVFSTIDSIVYRYSINKKGLVWDTELSKPIYPFKFKQAWVYGLRIGNSTVKFPMNKLFLMAFSPMHVSLETYINILDVRVFDKSTEVPDRSNLLWLVPEGGVECIRYPGFYSIPGNPDIVISKKYEFRKYRTGTQYTISQTEGAGYPCVSSRIEDCGKEEYPFIARLVHRLIALAFLPLPLTRKELYINHIDADKQNYAVGNLEWNTHLDNNTHALVNGLRTDNSPVVAVNTLTGEIRNYYSLQTAAKDLGIHAWTISVSRKTYAKEGKLRTRPWLFLWEGDRIPKSFNRINRTSVEPGFSHFRVINLTTGNVEYLRGIRNVSKYVKSNAPGVLIKSTTSFKIGVYRVEKISRDDVPLEVAYKLKNKPGAGGKIQKRIRVTDIITNAVTEYDSTDAFAALVGVKRKSIQHTANLRNGHWKNFKLEYI